MGSAVAWVAETVAGRVVAEREEVMAKEGEAKAPAKRARWCLDLSRRHHIRRAGSADKQQPLRPLKP
jgi:hypothetical protein